MNFTSQHFTLKSCDSNDMFNLYGEGREGKLIDYAELQANIVEIFTDLP